MFTPAACSPSRRLQRVSSAPLTRRTMSTIWGSPSGSFTYVKRYIKDKEALTPWMYPPPLPPSILEDHQALLFFRPAVFSSKSSRKRTRSSCSYTASCFTDRPKLRNVVIFFLVSYSWNCLPVAERMTTGLGVQMRNGLTITRFRWIHLTSLWLIESLET